MPPTAVHNGTRRRKETRETPAIQSLDRGLLILETVGKSGEPVSLGQLAGLLAIDRSSAFRLANTLKRRGFLTNPSAGKEYVLGPSVWRLSRLYDWTKMLAKVAHEPLKALAAETNETAHLAVREGRKALFIDHVITSQVIAISGQTGEFVPLYCTAHGKALLADFTEQELTKLFGGKQLKAHTHNTIQTVEALAAECGEIRTKGFASDESEHLEGLRCVAAPIRDRDGAVIASIGISAPATRLSKELQQGCAPTVVATAAQIGELVESLDE